MPSSKSFIASADKPAVALDAGAQPELRRFSRNRLGIFRLLGSKASSSFIASRESDSAPAISPDSTAASAIAP